MSVQIVLDEMKGHCSFVPLAVVGYCFTRSGLLQPLWSPLEVDMKVYNHTPEAKLQDVVVAIMAGCRSLNQVNTRLRPELALATAWQRSCFAEQSNLAQTLDALNQQHIDQLRAGHLALSKQHSQLRHHDWHQPLLLDIDATSLLASKRAEGSRKGWVSGKRNKYCRHVIRFTMAGYHESLLSLLYPGDRHAYEYCKPALKQLLMHWPWTKDQRRQIIVRSDAELGTDADVSYILWRGFQVLMKGYSGRRTQAWVKRTPEASWQVDPHRPDHWAAPAPSQLRLGRRLEAYLLRWYNHAKQKLDHATLLSTLPLPVFDLWNVYDDRGTTEVEIRSDKSGLWLHLRRKQSFNAQEAWIVLTDVAHNLAAWLQPWMLAGSAFESFGPKRLVHDLFTIPGQMVFENGRLHRVALLKTHPYADEMRYCLQRLLTTFDLD